MSHEEETILDLLQPLRIPPGWRVTWNTLCALDPTPENVELGYFGGSSLFHAVNEGRRFLIDVAWAPEDDTAGSYQMSVDYSPWVRTERGRRRNDVPPTHRDSENMHVFRTRSRVELVSELEAWLRRCTMCVREGS